MENSESELPADDGPGAKSEMIALRFTKRDLDEITTRAEERRMTRTAYMTAAALGRLDAEASDYLRELERVSKRLERLERFAFGGEG